MPQGGIPHCFPQFGPGAPPALLRRCHLACTRTGLHTSFARTLSHAALTPPPPRAPPATAGKMQLHGFARNLDWALTATVGAPTHTHTHTHTHIANPVPLTHTAFSLSSLLQAAPARPWR